MKKLLNTLYVLTPDSYLFCRNENIRDFDRDEEVVSLNERGRRTLLSAWEKRKQEQIVHPFLKEKVPIGLIPYVQAMLFARVLRGDLDDYPPFVWR